MNHHDQATLLEAQVRSSRSAVQIAGALRDLTAEVRELAEVVHKMAVLLAEREGQSPAMRPDVSEGASPESSAGRESTPSETSGGSR